MHFNDHILYRDLFEARWSSFLLVLFISLAFPSIEILTEVLISSFLLFICISLPNIFIEIRSEIFIALYAHLFAQVLLVNSIWSQVQLLAIFYMHLPANLLCCHLFVNGIEVFAHPNMHFPAHILIQICSGAPQGSLLLFICISLPFICQKSVFNLIWSLHCSLEAFLCPCSTWKSAFQPIRAFFLQFIQTYLPAFSVNIHLEAYDSSFLLFLWLSMPRFCIQIHFEAYSALLLYFNANILYRNSIFSF